MHWCFKQLFVCTLLFNGHMYVCGSATVYLLYLTSIQKKLFLVRLPSLRRCCPAAAPLLPRSLLSPSAHSCLLHRVQTSTPRQWVVHCLALILGARHCAQCTRDSSCQVSAAPAVSQGHDEYQRRLNHCVWITADQIAASLLLLSGSTIHSFV